MSSVYLSLLYRARQPQVASDCHTVSEIWNISEIMEISIVYQWAYAL